MKLKKVVAAVMAGTLAMFTMAGCSEQAMNYSKETEKMSSWEGQESKVEGTVNVDLMGQKVDLNFDANGHFNGKEGKGHMEMSFNDPSGTVKVPNIDMYVDNGTAYINKGYYTDAYTMNGLDIPAVINTIPAQYIGIDSGFSKEQLKSLSSADALNTLKKQFIGDVDIDIPMSQNDREYTVNLNEEQIATMVEKIITGAAGNLDSLSKNLNLGLDSAQIEEIKKTLQSDDFKAKLSQVKDIIAGSTITTKDTFADDSYTSEINIDLKIKDLGSIKVKANSTSTKSEKKDIEMPLGKVKFTQAQYMEMMMPAAANQETEAAK